MSMLNHNLHGLRRQLTEVIVAPHETFEAALRRSNKKVQQDGILAEVRRSQQFEKPSEGRKKKAARRRQQRT